MTQESQNILRELGQLFTFDAQDFLERFDVTREALTSKTARIKSMVDLLMAFECGLKAHIAFAAARDCRKPAEAYKDIKQAGHDITKLVTMATYVPDRTNYENIKDRLGAFSVTFRYSLNAYDAFFPWYLDQGEASLNYSNTVGSEVWVAGTRSLFDPLIQPAYDAFTGEVTPNITEIFSQDKAMKTFIEDVVRKKR